MKENRLEPEHPIEVVYEPPSIVYETIISTRAGSPIIEVDAPQPPAQGETIDLFPSD